MPEARDRSLPPARNPFVIGHHAEGDAFCDRVDEVTRIAAAFRDPSARLLIHGDRRQGKSSALRRAAAEVRDSGRPVVVVDLAIASSATAAAQRILAAVQQELGRRWQETAARLLTRLRPGTFTLKASTDAAGQPTLTFQVAPDVAPQDALVVTDVLDAVEAELEARDLELGVALDEFQRLGRWYGEEVAWQLKELLERHRRIGYVLAGSERSLIDQMLENRKAGLWKVVDVLHLQPIAATELVRWIVERATATGVRIDLVVAAAIVRLAGPRTRDVVQLARATWDWARPAGEAGRYAAHEAMEALVREQGALHLRLWERLTDVARRTLVTLATRPGVQPLAADTLAAYSLGPKSTVSSALDDLVAREVLARQPDGWEFDDPFFRRWVQVNGAGDLGEAPPPLAPPDLAGS